MLITGSWSDRLMVRLLPTVRFEAIDKGSGFPPEVKYTWPPKSSVVKSGSSNQLVQQTVRGVTVRWKM